MRIRDAGAVITGASRGLGEALAREIAARGGRVLLVARGKAEVERVASEIRAAGGVAHSFVADVADKRATYAIAGAAAELVGPVDILVHNASALGPVPLRLLLDTECEDFEDVFRVNVLGPFRLTKAIAGHMAVRGRGLIAFVSSDAAVNAYPRWGAYGVSKAAADQLARSFAAELADGGVRVWSVDPGEMNTKMHADAIPDADPNALRNPRDVARALVDRIERADVTPSGARLELEIAAP